MSNTLTTACTNLSRDDIANAKKVLDDYQTELSRIIGLIKADTTAMVGTDFIGDAANAYKATVDTVLDALTARISTGEKSLMNIIISYLNDAEKQIVDTTDPNLSQRNNNAVNQLTDNTAAPTA